MPVAGDEGYEKMVICPYDRAHEIRQGRMQFHLDKCRKNFPNAEMIQCPFNSVHRIPKVEEAYHTQEECTSRLNWDRHTHQVGSVDCPVKDLVPVNAATVPDGDENWDDFEAQGSVLNNIRTQAAEKDIFRMMQCESKAKRKNFRLNERERHKSLRDNTQESSSATSSVHYSSDPLPRPTKPSTIQVVRQDPAVAAATIEKQFRKWDLNVNVTGGDYAPSEASSICNNPPSLASFPSLVESNPLGRVNYSAAASGRSSAGMFPDDSRPSTSMSVAMSSTRSRPSTAMSIAASVNNTSATSSKDGFCQIPIPGLGRGLAARRKAKQ